MGMRATLADGSVCELLPVGTPIRRKCNHGDTGKIKGIEHLANGMVSAIPYLIDWDAPFSELGRFPYGCNDTIEAIPDAAALDDAADRHEFDERPPRYGEQE